MKYCIDRITEDIHKMARQAGVVLTSRELSKSIDKSINGSPGSKNAKFEYDSLYGNVFKNTSFGIYFIFITYHIILNFVNFVYKY